MKRRTFLSLSALSAAPLAARAADAELEPDWYETIDRGLLTFMAEAEDGKITLNVELIRPDENEITEAKDEKGEFRTYQYKGRDQPYPFHPGSALLIRFDLTWGGQAVEIPKRFWVDLPGFDLEISTLDPEKLRPDLRWKALEFLESLRHPRISLSAEGGTVLIEWVRPEECDARSTIRWIVSKTGSVLRHRHCPPHEC